MHGRRVLPPLAPLNPYASPEQLPVELLVIGESEPQRHIVVSIIGWSFAVVGTAILVLTALVTCVSWAAYDYAPVFGLALAGAYFVAYFSGIAVALVVFSGGWGKRIDPIHIMPAINWTLFCIAMITSGVFIVWTGNLW